VSDEKDDTVEPAPAPMPAPKRKRARIKKKVHGVSARLTQLELEERRDQVEKLRTRGLGVRNIAKLLNLNQETVMNDLRAVKEVNSKRITEFEKNQHLGDSLARFDQFRQEAWARYHAAKEERHKLKALEVLVSIEKEQKSMLLDTGVIAKPKEEAPTVEVKHTLKLDWSPDMRSRVAEALLQQSLKSNLAEPTPELSAVQDAELVTVTVTSTDETETATETEDPDGS